MHEESKTMKMLKVWKLVNFPKDSKSIQMKWFADIKQDSKETLEWFKAKIVAKGFNQKECVNYFEVLSPVTRYRTDRFLIAASVQFGWKRISMDENTASLNAPLKKKIYVNQPKRFIKNGFESMLYLLFKAHYGWNKIFVFGSIW